MKTESDITINLSKRELFVVINALNYAKNEWAMVNDEELTKLSDEAEKLEARLKEQQ